MLCKRKNKNLVPVLVRYLLSFDRFVLGKLSLILAPSLVNVLSVPYGYPNPQHEKSSVSGIVKICASKF